MRFDDLWIAGTGSELGDLIPVDEDVATGAYAEKDAREAGTISVSRSTLAPPDMAVIAGRQALDAAASAPRPTLHLHGSTYFQGLDMWPVACHIANRLLGDELDGLSMQASALSNSSLACLELAGSLLNGRPDVPAALITVADRFAPPGIDRWNIDSGMAFGDAAAAAVLTRGQGQLRVLSAASFSDTALEGLQRGDEPFRPVSPTAVQTLDMRSRLRAFFAKSELTPKDARRRSVDAVTRVVNTALADADRSLPKARWVIPPFVGRRLFEGGFMEPLGLNREQTLFDLGLRTGHLGSVDQLLAVDHLVRNGLLDPGDTIVLIGTGMGFTFSATVLSA